MPKMESNGGAVASWPPIELVFVNAFSKFQNNFMNILEHKENVVESLRGHNVFL
jgi:hypothetical protein